MAQPKMSFRLANEEIGLTDFYCPSFTSSSSAHFVDICVSDDVVPTAQCGGTVCLEGIFTCGALRVGSAISVDCVELTALLISQLHLILFLKHFIEYLLHGLLYWMQFYVKL
jgi:hypothetical protein